MLSSLIAFMAEFFIFFIIYFIFYIFVCIFALFIGGVPRIYQNKSTGHSKVLRPRFSFTYYFFGFWTPLIRKHWISFAIAFVIDFFTVGIGRIIYAFIINKTYINFLLENGYELVENNPYQEVSEQ
ncbi:MAG: hypothetical protein ACK5LV_09005 [Lachnospirales bacterium]